MSKTATKTGIQTDPKRELSDYPTQRTVPANSVFQVAQQARQQPGRSSQVRSPIDLANLKTYTARPLPDLLCGRGARSSFAIIWEEKLTTVGASVDLNRTQAKSMISWAKKNGKKVAMRQLGPDLFGVWRME